MILDGDSKVGEAKVYATAKEMQLTKELEITKKLLSESVRLIGEMEEYLGRFGMRNSIESTSLFHQGMTNFLAKLSMKK